MQGDGDKNKLMLPKCSACNRLHWYPRSACPFCLSNDIGRQEASGQGTVYSVTVFARAGEARAIAYVTLDEGLRLLTNIVTSDPHSIFIGQRVEAVVDPASDVSGQGGAPGHTEEEPETLPPFFRPIDG